MSRIVYHKLVRDRIPMIIEADNKACICSVLNDAEYLALLEEKLDEELKEYQQSGDMEELADLLEVIRAVAVHRLGSFEALEDIRRQKALARGGFAKRLKLEEVRDYSDEPYLLEHPADWSLFKDGFALRTAEQAWFQAQPELHTEPHQAKDIVLRIGGMCCDAQLRNITPDPARHPGHAPIIQIRYGCEDSAAQQFRKIFSRTYAALCVDKQTAPSGKHMKSDCGEHLRIYATDDPRTLQVICYPAKEARP